MNPFIGNEPLNLQDAYFQIPRDQVGYDPSTEREMQARMIAAVNALSQDYAQDG
jgi:hypothetical protein